MSQTERDETLVKSYLYVRVALVAVLLFLGAAVAYQSLEQGSILASISAYYYTPAQAVFVSALVALGVSMIALQGTTHAEDVLLNVGGMLAPVVAIIPTSRGADFRDAVAACKESASGAGFGGPAQPGVDCPTVRALVETAEANIDNNMWALFVAGAAGLAVTPTLARHFGKSFLRIRRSYVFAVILYAIALAAFIVWRPQFIDLAHYAAAIGLFVSIVLVAIVNAVRHQDLELFVDGKLAWDSIRRALLAHERYARIAVAMLVVALVGIPAAAVQLFPSALFVLEAALILLFAVLWIMQTWERAMRGTGTTEQAPAIGSLP